MRALAFVLLFSGSLRAQPVVESHADLLRQIGEDELKRGDFARALVTFERAYQETPTPKLKFQIALALMGLDREAEAFVFFDEFIASNPDAPQAQLSQAIAQVQAL